MSLLLLFAGARTGASTTTTVTGADGPPWGLTGQEKRQLKKYYDELAKLQEEWDENHRSSAQQLLNDVRRAAGLQVDEPEPDEIEPVSVVEIRERIVALPPLPGLLAVNLQALRDMAAEHARLAMEEDDEEAISILLLH